MKNKLEQLLKDAGMVYEFIELPEELAMDIKVHMRFHGGELSLAMPNIVFRTDKGLIVAQRLGDTQIDNKKLKKLAGVQRLSLASKEDLESLGLEPGIVPPFGYDARFFLDEKVLVNNEIYTGTGDKLFALKMSPKDLVKLNSATVGDFTSHNKEAVGSRIITGDTPTGKLHLGHYVGTLENRVKLQDKYETYIVLADLHALTTLSENPQVIAEHTRQVAMDNLAVGLDPDKVNIFVESRVPEIYELAAIFSMYVSHNRALRNPTIKDEIKMKGLGDQFSLGFVNYPIYQAADILCVKGELVPVGMDQEAHLEQTREIARDLNQLAGKDIFPEPKALIGRVGKLVGTDGNPKMGKSLGNVIYLSESQDEVVKKVMDMYTDPKRIHPTDPGEVEGNPVFVYHGAFNDNKEEVDDLRKRYKEGKVGDVEVKEKLAAALNRFLDLIRERRAKYESQPELVEEILNKGSEKVREETIKTLQEVKEVTGLR